MTSLKEEMTIVSTSRDFNPRLSNDEFKKLVLLDEPILNKIEPNIPTPLQKPLVSENGSDNSIEYTSETEFDIFADNPKTVYSNTTLTRNKLVLNLSFTKDQWSGKTPKQYFIDYLSKHSKGTKATFTQLEKNGYEFRCSIKLFGGHVNFDGKSCEMTKDELCTTARDSEFYVVVFFQLLFIFIDRRN